jgi:WD40 repeat protein
VPGSIALNTTSEILVFWNTYIGSEILLVDPTTGDISNRLLPDNAFDGVVLSPVENFLLTWEESDGMSLWNMQTGEMITTIDTQSIQDAIFGRDGTRLVTAHIDGTLNLWQVEQ